MARTIEQIQAELLTVKANQPVLNDLNSTSRAAIWRLWLFIVAYCAHTLEKLYDIHHTELYTALYELKPHTARSYRNKALTFLYGFDLIEDSDVFALGNATEEQIEAARMVKYAAVVESEDISRLIIKIAGENEQKVLAPIPDGSDGTADVKSAFDYYMSEVRDAGVRLTIINYLPDLLKLNLTIQRDPLVLDENGVNILSGKETVKEAIHAYMKELPFNGQLSLQTLTDKIQAVPGVLDIAIDLAQTAWIDAEIDTYGEYQNIYMHHIPVSGYFAVELDDTEHENYSTIHYV